ncbi:MAG: oligosaccharide flippase family protein [Pleurocapsa minor GSE-CHR-MK-17-07R]|jgi:O-antigen/teichoic acid export membrane protein|nr:oligosaccharide flippase family protein [Pleurocapsa minor GSE-CHR-MK 17-07R]
MRRLFQQRGRDFAVLALLFLLPLIAFWPQTLGGKTLLPAENLYQYEPYAAYREATGAAQPPPEIPHNHLLSDLVLQNVQWKSFILENLRAGEIPLWNPYQFAGVPFLAAGQQSTLYPFSLLYYALPLETAYGWFTVVQLWIAGAGLFALARGLGASRTGATIAGITYQLAAFFVTSAVFPMMIAGAAWLPVVLLMCENIIARRGILRGRPGAPVWMGIGALALGLCVLAGHVEIVYYTLIIAAYYSAGRLLWGLARRGTDALSTRLRAAVVSGLWLLGMVVLGIALGGVQFVPLFELASINFRSGSAGLDEVLGWAHPFRDVVQFAMPNFYGSPAHHSYLDVFSGQTVSLIDNIVTNAAGARITHTEWGMKNYVEAALYVGVLPLILVVTGMVALAVSRRRGADAPADNSPAPRWILASLGVLALTFMFGLPTYALLYYGFPGINQLHSPFRWIFAVTLCVAVLAAFGWDALTTRKQLARRLGLSVFITGLVVLGGLLLSRALYEPVFAGLIERVFTGMAKAADVFPDARAFYSYTFGNVLQFGLVLAASGAAVWWAGRDDRLTRRLSAGLIASLVIAIDLLAAHWGFNPASDPAWLNYTPPAITWLQENTHDETGHAIWRFTTLDDPTQRPLLNANMTMRYGLADIRGYESIIPKQYVDFMNQIAPPMQLDYNRVAPFYTVYPDGVAFEAQAALESPLLDALNVRYVVTHRTTDISAYDGYTLAYEDDAVRIWENTQAAPRARVLTDGGEQAAALVSGSPRESFYRVTVTDPGTLVISETYLPGWRAYALPLDADGNPTADEETLLETGLNNGNFIGVALPDAPGFYQIRVVYSPQSFQVGLFASFIAVIVLALVGGVTLWGMLAPPKTGESGGGLGVIARNSIAPILLNLFNRGIDFAFAFVMLRILGPNDAGAYFYAGVIFVWFDILTNFGLNLFVTREVSRDRSKARLYFFNSSAMRIGLAVLGVPLLVGLLGFRQATTTPPLDATTLLAIGVLYVGLLPNSLSTGMTSLYYAFERAEMPALVATMATISKTVGGLIALLLGWGIVGLAAVSIVTNVITLAILLWNGRAMLGAGAMPRPDLALMRRMAGQSWPLMLNHFLATIFFQIDVVLIEAIHGNRMVGQYQIAYKWLTALNVIPAFFTQAMLPRMSRMAQEDPAALKSTYVLAIKLLVSIALPLAVIITFAAYAMTTLLGGAEYLPDGAIATQLMIWSIPIGWMNSFTQYVLIALDLQRRITGAFIAAVSFNLIANAIFIPQYGYQAAALTTIASEAILWIPFYLLLRGAMGDVPWLAVLWRPLAAGGLMLGAMLLLWPTNELIGLAGGLLAYGAAWMSLHVLNQDEWQRLGPLLPGRLRARLAM